MDVPDAAPRLAFSFSSLWAGEAMTLPNANRSHGDLPKANLASGDVGSVVHVYRDAVAFEVEFVALDGEIVVVVTPEHAQIRPVEHRTIAPARRVT